MMTITRNQNKTLAEYMRLSFEKNAVIHLREKYPGTSTKYSDPDLLRLVQDGIDKSAGYNITERNDVLPYIEYMLCLGKEFDTDAPGVWLKRTLKIRNLSGKEKMKRLMKLQPLKPDFN